MAPGHRLCSPLRAQNSHEVECRNDRPRGRRTSQIARDQPAPTKDLAYLRARFGFEPATGPFAAKVVPPRCAAGLHLLRSLRPVARGCSRTEPTKGARNAHIRSRPTSRPPAVEHRPAHRYRRRGPAPSPSWLPDLVRLRRDVLVEPPRTFRRLPPATVRPHHPPPAFTPSATAGRLWPSRQVFP